MDVAPRLWVVDVCGTLVAEDTTLGLIRFHLERRGSRVRATMFRALAGKKSAARYGAMAMEKMCGMPLLKFAGLSMLRGERVEELERSASEYAEWLLAHRRVESVFALLEEPLSRDCVVLASASLQPIVAALAARMGCGYVASQLGVSNGVVTGRYRVDLTERKLKAIRKMLGLDLRITPYCAVTDNHTDRGLVEGAERAWVVLNKPGHAVRWAGVPCAMIRTYL